MIAIEPGTFVRVEVAGTLRDRPNESPFHTRKHVCETRWNDVVFVLCCVRTKGSSLIQCLVFLSRNGALGWTWAERLAPVT